MSYNTKNYTEQGGEKTVIGGTLEIKEGASVTGLSANPLLVATEETLGGVKAAAADEGDTVEIKIGEDGKLYAPTYPTDATESVSGLVKMAANQADSIAEDTATLVTDFNALLARLKAAGLMAADEE
ncbi:head fiber protein [Amphibacillus sediminis]|uniref:head fiber protein n=1 Tax=Amphibacillus sediminis TaxID=360185 RepID=UPI000836110A|nr:head fiber protein [Amphibacillus sediminis]